MIPLSYGSYRVASGLGYSRPRALTPSGLLVFGGLILVGSASFDMDKTTGYQAFALLLCLLTTSLLSKRFFRVRFTAQRNLPKLASVGQPFRYVVRIHNLSKSAFRDLELFEEPADPRPSRREYRELRQPDKPFRSFKLFVRRAPNPRRVFRRAITPAVRVPHLPAGGWTEATVEIRPVRRGTLRLEALSLARPDPIGLARSFVRVAMPQSVLVLPRRYPLPAFSLPGSRKHQPGGVALSSSVGAAEEFVSLREYRPGDPLRHIHWRSWARLGRPIVREFQDESFPRHALILDTFATAAQSEAFEEAVSVAASFACTVDTQESLLDLLFAGPQAVCFTTGRGLGQAEQALEILAAIPRCPDKPFETLRHLVVQHASKVCGAVCVFLKWDPARRELVRELQQIGLPVLTLVIDVPPKIADTGLIPSDVHYLDPGHIAEGLQKLHALA
jgi:uncharacterized protein (DUF58 family)